MARVHPIFVCALLAACSQAETPPEQPAAAPLAPVQVSYSCESGRNVAAEYPDRTSARLTYEGRTHVLQSLPAASGARYAGAELEWWTAVRNGQESGTLRRVPADAETEGRVIERCSRPASDVAPPKPQPAPVTPGAAAAVAPPCKGGQLRLEAAGGDAGMGHRILIVGARNTGAAACSLTGWPAVAVQDRQNRDLTAVRAEQATGSYLRAGQQPSPVELAPGGQAFFDVASTVIPNEAEGETTCPSVARLKVTAPGDIAPVFLAQALTACGRKVEVTPFRAEAEPAPAD